MGVGGQRHAPAALPLRKRPGAHCIVGWVGPKDGLDGCEKPRPPNEIRSPDRPTRSSVAIPTELSRPTVHMDNALKVCVEQTCKNFEPNAPDADCK